VSCGLDVGMRIMTIIRQYVLQHRQQKEWQLVLVVVVNLSACKELVLVNPNTFHISVGECIVSVLAGHKQKTKC
jgi:hypothetical protein